MCDGGPQSERRARAIDHTRRTERVPGRSREARGLHLSDEPTGTSGGGVMARGDVEGFAEDPEDRGVQRPGGGGRRGGLFSAAFLVAARVAAARITKIANGPTIASTAAMAFSIFRWMRARRKRIKAREAALAQGSDADPDDATTSAPTHTSPTRSMLPRPRRALRRRPAEPVPQHVREAMRAARRSAAVATRARRAGASETEAQLVGESMNMISEQDLETLGEAIGRQLREYLLAPEDGVPAVEHLTQLLGGLQVYPGTESGFIPGNVEIRGEPEGRPRTNLPLPQEDTSSDDTDTDTDSAGSCQTGSSCTLSLRSTPW